MSNGTVGDDSVQCLFFYHTNDSETSLGLCDEVNNTIQALSQGYIWHRDELKVYLPIFRNEDKDLAAQLMSITCFGDNIEDEWFIVYLILEITKKYKFMIVQIQDNDGDFLLIEAADFLPSWANPNTTVNRVFISNGEIHLIAPKFPGEELNVEEAITMISSQTKVPDAVMDAIQRRIGNYPSKIQENLHNALVNVPVDIATVLTLKPSLISTIVTAYCTHDVIDAKKIKNFTIVDTITTQVKFTKCLYAMLVHSKILSTGLKDVSKDKRTMLGLKIAYGYEIIKSQSADVYCTKEFTAFFNNLKKIGYFKKYLEGSKDYKILAEKAKDFYKNMECPIKLHAYNEIKDLMLAKEFEEVKSSFKNQNNVDEEDNDDWLNIHPEQLNDMLNQRYGNNLKFRNGDHITPECITSELSNFLKKSSDYEGIENNRDSEQSDDDNEIEFDSNEFVNSLQKMHNLVSCDNAEDEDMNDSLNSDEDEIMADYELRDKLNDNNIYDDKSVIENIKQSIKEEGSSSGPSSILLKSLGMVKEEILDSDDE